jgi:hypothetical protein
VELAVTPPIFPGALDLHPPMMIRKDMDRHRHLVAKKSALAWIEGERLEGPGKWVVEDGRGAHLGAPVLCRAALANSVLLSHGQAGSRSCLLGLEGYQKHVLQMCRKIKCPERSVHQHVADYRSDPILHAAVANHPASQSMTGDYVRFRLT